MEKVEEQKRDLAEDRMREALGANLNGSNQSA